jgi:hypothetical protein
MRGVGGEYPRNPHGVLRVRSAAAVERLWRFIENVEMEIIPFDEAQVHGAAVAFDRYGKGVNPKARLNLGDCAAYALAKTLNVAAAVQGRRPLRTHGCAAGARPDRMIGKTRVPHIGSRSSRSRMGRQLSSGSMSIAISRSSSSSSPSSLATRAIVKT